jgi:hypothetical protein
MEVVGAKFAAGTCQVHSAWHRLTEIVFGMYNRI